MQFLVGISIKTALKSLSMLIQIPLGIGLTQAGLFLELNLIWNLSSFMKLHTVLDFFQVITLKTTRLNQISEKLP
jgi:hypothetical protein